MARGELHAGRDPGARRRHRQRRAAVRRDQGITAATDVPRTSADRYVVVTPPAGGALRPAVAEMYVTKALLPAARTTDAGAATLRVRISPSGAIAVERVR